MTETKREAWLAARKKQIGASELAVIFNASPYKTPWELWAEKTGRLASYDGSGNAAIAAGNRFESGVLDAAEADLGKLERDVRLIDPDVPLAATLDARVVDCGKPVEAKTTGLVGPVSGEWGEPDTGDFPVHYQFQVLAQCIVTGKPEGFLYALIAGRGVVRYRMTPDPELCVTVKEQVDRWWRTHITGDLEPDPTAGGVSLDAAKRLIVEPGSVGKFTETELLNRLDDANKSLAIAKKEADAAKALVLAHLGSAEAAELEDGRMVTNYEQVRQNKAREASESRFRVLRIKKAPKGKAK